MQSIFNIARQPILDKNGHLHGYEFFFKSSDSQPSSSFQSGANDLQATHHVLSSLLQNSDSISDFQFIRSFINVSHKTLFSDFLELLPPSSTVFEIASSTVIVPKVLDRISSLRNLGYSFLLDDCFHFPDKKTLFPFCSYFKIDTQRTGMLGLLESMDLFESLHLPDVQIIASKIETEPEKRQSQLMGCTFFQGYYFENPERVKNQSLSSNAVSLLKLLQHIRHQSDISILEDVLKKDAASSLKLLRYINSAEFSLPTPIYSIRQAIQLLGYSKLNRWTLLLLATSNTQAPPALAQSAIARGRFLELLGQFLRLPDESVDHLFLLGTLSGLRSIMDFNHSSFKALSLHPDILQPLLSSCGHLFPYLELAESIEHQTFDIQNTLFNTLNLSPTETFRIFFQALSWSEKFFKFKD